MKKPLVVITGASSGIGQATAKLLSSYGYPLLLIARRIERMESLNLPNTLCMAVDVTDKKSFSKAIEQAEQKFGPVDALINNAGVMLLGSMELQDSNEWEQMLNVNVKGMMNGISAVTKGMINRKNGTIINISSVAGRKTFPNHTVYVGTKFAVHGMSENLREELSKYNIRVTIIAPGAVETELLSHTSDKKIKEEYQDWKKSMGGEVLTAEDVAKAINYAYSQPQNICIREIVLASTKQEA
ncbi:SDR family oxidoreductase [Xenorhabdus hominickii]|uniref:Oxidoreductase n=1 Tax=Xenorhabdus hominickii TaxID=351679 RepID=A0A2G0QDB6_XENHO|nr:SDR family oxidoreductase [Xenorhabdus hominickii]AOM41314.1 oxidoreductase [Xenorhabdus hominickii]PHM55425.1 short chain dehydrogenase/reductase family oxidoreductase [Xenorhabdus hominickii]PHM57210.1 short chain dehydrogenase/reductase family oxidoreductase [Xenorhabdus hominickii]